jgi:hypothetical protein
MTIKELKDELDCYDDEDMEVVFELDDDVDVESWTETRWGTKRVHIDAYLKPFFMSDHLGKFRMELVIDKG